ncbi:MAG: asparaginase [Actinomycetota bacterium]
MRCGVEVLRGGLVESVHTVSVAICHASPTGELVDADVTAAGTVVAADSPRGVARSAVKPLQAVPLVETGAADRFGLDTAELAVAAGSHGGDEPHVAAVRSLLAKVGLTPDALECGPHPPLDRGAADALVRRGEAARPEHNNCSGKHAGMLAVCRHLGLPLAGYTAADHPVQRLVTTTLRELAGVGEGEMIGGIDGCGIPAFALPLAAWARAYARFGSAGGLSPARAGAAERLRRAIAARPTMIAGVGQFDSLVAGLLGPDILVKTGAEGTLAGFVVGSDGTTGLAVKASDGSPRAARAVMARLIGLFAVAMEPAARDLLERWSQEEIVNHAGVVVGGLRVVLPDAAAGGPHRIPLA